ncbi:MAG TPA: DUF3592 domain-containing protein [Chloroflexia bacterium]|nr:DUF3592 domain-containing protein [Chloroflexia bacterium]
MVLRSFGLIFGAIGALALLIVLIFTIGNLTFISQAATANGTVINLKQGGRAYFPVIRFSTSAGQAIQFTGNNGSSPPEFQIGQNVKVFYKPDNPASSAKADSFLSFWFEAMLAGIFALIFGGIGLVCYSFYYFIQRKIKWLQRHGQRVIGQVSSIRLNTHVRNRGKSPRVVTVHWLNPQSGRMHTFTSGNIWLEPLPFEAGSPISILIDPSNLNRYYVDPAALPLGTS